jgi:hypothetical protein
MTRARVAGVVAAAALVASPPAAWAQKPIPESVRMMEPHRLRIGDVVRAWPTAAGPPIQGTVVGVSASTLTVATRQEAELVTLPALHHMEVKRTRSHIRLATAIGAGLGVLAGVFLATEDVVGRELDAGERVAWTAGLAAGGAATGAAVGLLTRSVTWQPVDLVTLKPQAADMRPALRVSWTVRF